MTSVIASLVLVCTPAPGAARESAPVLLHRDLRSLQGKLVEGVEAVLKGVTLFETGATAAARRTFALRPDIGSKGPVAMFDLRF